MAGVISDLKSHARTLHRQVLGGEPRAVARVQRQFPELFEGDADAFVRNVRRRHCLSVLARELGFRGWQHAVASMGGGTASGRQTIARFVIDRGRVVSESRLSSDDCDRGPMIVARDAVARLRSGAAEVAVRAADGSDIAVGLAPPAIPSEALDRLPAAAREQLMEWRKALQQKERVTHFYLKVGGLFEPHILVEGESADLLALARMYGALGGTFIRDQLSKPEIERELAWSPVRREQFIENAAAIVRAAPAMVCTGRLTGFAAAFADCFAIVMLSKVDPSTT